MKIKFKSQPYQTYAVDAVVDCFEGQPRQDVLKYTIDPGADRQAKMEVEGFGNAPVKLPEDVLLENIRKVQRGAMLPPSDSLTHHTDDKGKTKPASYKPGAQINLDVEMETGTGKTYVHQDHVRDAQTLWLVQVHHHGAQRGDPRRGGQVDPDDG